MKRRKTRTLPFPSGRPEEPAAFNAKDALGLGSGQELAIGQYVQDVAEVLNRVADLLDPKPNQNQTVQLQFVVRGRRGAPAKKTPASRKEDEWDGSLRQAEEAIKNRRAKALGGYLRDAAGGLGELGAVLAPPAEFKGWRLEFVRKGRGRRPDPGKHWEDADITQDLCIQTIIAGKQEAAIVEVAHDRKISRATVMRAKKTFSKPSKKSQKKR